MYRAVIADELGPLETTVWVRSNRRRWKPAGSC